MRNKYWFRKRKYGWGWTPSTWEGWLITLIFLCVYLYVALTMSDEAVAEEGMFRILFLPLLALVILFLAIVWKKGEPLGKNKIEGDEND